jgi:glycosyltransferase involved in cell wall biosynthesis
MVHLTASTFFGGPERQMLGLAGSLETTYRTVFVSFAEGGRCGAFLEQARQQGFEAVALGHDTPHLAAAVRDLCALLRGVRPAVLCCHSYKANLLGRIAARRCGVPVVSVSRGWTGESLRVRLYEMLDRVNLRWMDRVVCVSGGQQHKVRRAGVPAGQTLVIRNAIVAQRFDVPDPSYRARLQEMFPGPPRLIVGAAGRLSPDKGFDVLIRAAEVVRRRDATVGFVLFGDGWHRDALARQIAAAGLEGHFVLAGFRGDLDRFMPLLDLFVLPSYTEGLPNVVLEASAAAVPVVATAVGGTPEVLDDGVTGYLVPPGEPQALAARILDLAGSEERRRAMGQRGRERVLRDFTFAAQAERYRQLFEELAA